MEKSKLKITKKANQNSITEPDEEGFFSRTERVIGKDRLSRLSKSKVAVFGLGGVGGYVVEALARTGIGSLDIIDHDKVSPSNINRQLIATRENIGKSKTELWKKRISIINPDILVSSYPMFYLPGNFSDFDFASWDYIVDAIDTVAAKVDLILQAKKHEIPIISAMGCGNRMDPGTLVITDIYKTSTDPLARVIRKRLRNEGVKNLKVVYSTETPVKSQQRTPGSTIFVPASAGLLIASQVIRDLSN